MVKKESVDVVLAHVEKRVLDKVSLLMETATNSEEQKVISRVCSEILQTIRHT